MTYRYTINGADVSPRGDWEINYERNVGQIFFRRVLTGDLTFIGDDYQTIMGMSDCDVLEFIIYCGVSIHWEGQFKFPYDFDINEDSCSMLGTPEVVDDYTCIMSHYDQEYYLTHVGGTTSTPELRTCVGALLDTLPTCRTIFWYLDTLINDAVNMDCDFSGNIKSSFLWRDNFPNGTNYAGAYAANNYITGAGNRLEYIFLIKNSALRTHYGGTACDSLAQNTYTFKKFEEFLRNAFNAYWFIDENGEFRIEHIHFFDADFPESDYEPDIDLTALVSSNGKTFAYRRNKYTYETGELYDQERWTWQHYEGDEGTGITHGADFEGVPLTYGPGAGEKSDCVPGEFKERKIATPNFWSDIEWAYQLRMVGGAAMPDKIACTGLCMLDIDTSGTDVVRCEAGDISLANIINGHCSTANLSEHYNLYDRVFVGGIVNNNVLVRTLTAQRHKLQEAIEFEHCCLDEFDPLDLIKTELGEGAVKTVVQKKRSIEIELLY